MTASLLNYSFSITVSRSHAEISAAVPFSCETMCFVDIHINFKAFLLSKGCKMHFRMNNTFLCMLTILTSLYSFSFHYLIDITTTAIMMMIIIKYILLFIIIIINSPLLCKVINNYVNNNKH